MAKTRVPQQEQESVLEMKIKLLRGQMMLIQETQDNMSTTVHEKLELILEQTRKTNGSVVELKKDVSELKDKTHELELADANHGKNCPQAERIDDIEEDLLEYKFFKKNTWFIYIGIAAVSIGVFIGIYQIFLKP